MSRCVLFIGHGTTRPAGRAEFFELVRQVSARLRMGSMSGGEAHGRVSVRHAFLEFAEPTIAQAIEDAVTSGIRELLLVPVFLFAARHLKHDIPQQLRALGEQLRDVSVHSTAAVGDCDGLLDAAYARLQAAGFTRGTDGTVVLVARGNHDPQAQAAFEAVARRLQGRFAIPKLAWAYLSGTGVPLEMVLARLSHAGERTFWILPYLWFQGFLTETLAERVRRAVDFAGVGAAARIRIAAHLGVHPRAVEAVAQSIAPFVGLQPSQPVQ
ncbi:MAG: sirohydrochlorin chelatase [Alicyclobacillus sp.]|nr:sirohydrochlorin chelatase [Alicyclobacillus sp.]